jgi:phage protein U
MMMAFGQFVFSLDTLAYQDLQRQTSWRHPSNSRVGARPARQYTGPGEETIHLNGLLRPGFAGDTGSLDELRAMGAAGETWPLVDGTGIVYGQFVIETLNERRSLFYRDGEARRIEFELQLARVDDDRVDAIGEDEQTRE